MIETNKKRRTSLGSILSMLERAASLTKTVLDEEGDCLDNIPENLQTSERYEAIERAVDNLEEAVSQIETAQERIEEAME